MNEMGVVAAALGSIFTSVGTGIATVASSIATGAAGLFAGGAAGGGLGLLGGIVGGIGQGLMTKNTMREQENQRIREEQRLTDSYEGAGQALRFWENRDPENSGQIDPNYQRPDANSNRNLPIGTTEQTMRPGEQYRQRTQPTQTRYRYDRNTGAILPA